MSVLDFYKGKRVFVTGCTGFKGSWLCKMLTGAGAIVTGYSLEPPTTPNLFSLSKLENEMVCEIGDIRDYDHLKRCFDNARPEIVFHLAAQPIVRESYKNPKYTYETNVMGTVNILECVRNADFKVESVLNVTTDKVYKNFERNEGYREDEMLDGYDPYSNSKSCSELVTHSYKNSFFADENSPRISTARAGNVIGGGDFASDRIIPDCVRALMENKTIEIRNPYSVRPYQHVLEPLAVYLTIAKEQYQSPEKSGWYNVGPDECDCVTTGELVNMFCEFWDNLKWENRSEENAVHEANFLKLDCAKIKEVFGWKPRWYIEKAVEKTCDWTRVWLSGGDIPDETEKEINEFFNSEK